MLSGCVPHTPIPTPEERIKQISSVISKARWREQSLHTTYFTLKTYRSPSSKKATLITIYIEGDGLAWLSEDRPSENPTPRVPTGLFMALHNSKDHPVAYIARPCQFVVEEEWRGCQQAYWTHLRFSPEVIDSMNQAVEQLKKSYQAQQIRLIGYSGGGAVATLISAMRTDVVHLITVAAPLDSDYWVRQEHLTPLAGSLNPAAAWKQLISIPQTHWVGGKDNVVSKEVALAFTQRFPATQKPTVIEVSNFDHACCWTDLDVTRQTTASVLAHSGASAQ